MGSEIAPDLVVPGPVTSQAASSTAPEELRSRANAFIRNEKFNRSLKLAATEAHGDLTVTYAVGGLDSEAAPTMLFIGGIFGERYLAAVADHVGEKLGMRIVVTDRPGMGGSTPVHPSLRLPIWLETVPALMRVLNAQHISLSAHSCGAIYALNTVHSMPWILPPSNRKLYLFSPWVPPNHSGMTYLSISSYFPSSVISTLDNVVRLVNSTVMSTEHFSGMVSGAVSALFSAISRGEPTDWDRSAEERERDDLCLKYCGVTAAENVARAKAITHAIFSESTSGANHEALLALKKKVAGSWRVCDSYESYPGALEAKMQEYFQQAAQEGPGAAPDSSAADGPDATADQHRFVLKTFWAETDMLIGRQGREYFDKCFQRFSHPAHHDGSEDGSSLLYESEVVPGTKHDTLILPLYGALSRALEDVLGATV